MKGYKFLASLMLLLCTCISMYAQEKTITGTVVSEESGPLPGVNVIIKGTNNGALTDFDGIYTIQASIGDILVFSYVGMITEERVVGDSITIDITLTTDSNLLEEIVITALGLSKDERTLGYSAQSVQSEEISKGTESNIVNALNGKVAGVNITSSNGSPGASSNIVIRGSSSISGNNQPLFVVDGLPINNNTDNGAELGILDGTTFEDYGETVGTNRAADIDPNDIESVSVLKDASAAIYGAQAANGVILITTKKGKTGKPVLSFTFNQGFVQPTKLADMAD